MLHAVTLSNPRACASLRSMTELVTRAYETELAWLALGHRQRRTRWHSIVREPRAPDVYDANFAALPRAESPAEIDEAIAELEAEFADAEHRQIFWDPATPLPYEARLQLDDYAPHDEVVLVLEGPLAARPRDGVAIRPVERDADWDVVTELCWQDHQEEVAKGFHGAWPRAITERVVACKRYKAPAVQFFLARVDVAAPDAVQSIDGHDPLAHFCAALRTVIAIRTAAAVRGSPFVAQAGAAVMRTGATLHMSSPTQRLAQPVSTAAAASA